MMDNALIIYQNLPLHINPIAFKIGFFQIGWYAISYIAGFAVVYGLLKYRMKKREGEALISNKNLKFPIKTSNQGDFTGKIQNQNVTLSEFFMRAVIGVLIGGRLGYVLFYNLPYYLMHPIEIISPYSFKEHVWIGVYGMSYHGGLLAVILVAVWFCRKNRINPHTNYASRLVINNKNEENLSVEEPLLKEEIDVGVNFWDLSDFVVPAIPAGYFFGRIGNFLNGELYGRITESSWGMYFFDGKNTFLRYPSQLIEAFLEGIVIFCILWIFRNNPFLKGKMLFVYIFLYGLARFLAEFFRQPDEQIGFFYGFLTLGQILSLLMIFVGLFSFFFRRWYNRA